MGRRALCSDMRLWNRQLLLLLLAVSAAAACLLQPMRKGSRMRLALELDPVLASAVATCVVRAPSTTTIIRAYVTQQRVGPSSFVRRLLHKLASAEDMTFYRMVTDSLCTQGTEWVLDILPRWH